ncbi:MAG: c-type cytochrome [Gammaproteobacteria bacterium]|nr:c-type cytochrome [Gammaproteobacteria bacterium]
MKRTFARILAFVVLIDLFFFYVGQTLTQAEQHPPARLAITVDTDVDTLVVMGESLVKNKGSCLICHKIAETGNERGPDLRGIGGQAGSRQPGVDAETYLMQALSQPAAFMVEGYSNIMPPANKPPVDLSATELKAVAAYLQSLGGEVTVKVTPEDESAAAKTTEQEDISPGLTLMTQKACTACHDFEGDNRLIGPPLTGIQERMSREQILQAIVDPDAIVAEGFVSNLMPKTYATELTPAQVKLMVDFLAGPEKVGWIKELWDHPAAQLFFLILLFNAGMLLAMRWTAKV